MPCPQDRRAGVYLWVQFTPCPTTIFFGILCSSQVACGPGAQLSPTPKSAAHRWTDSNRRRWVLEALSVNLPSSARPTVPGRCPMSSYILQRPSRTLESMKTTQTTQKLLTRQEVARIVGRKVNTIDVSRSRGVFPQPDHYMDNKPLWYEATIEAYLLTRKSRGRPRAQRAC